MISTLFVLVNVCGYYAVRSYWNKFYREKLKRVARVIYSFIHFSYYHVSGIELRTLDLGFPEKI